jgi:hypothetical protein
VIALRIWSWSWLLVAGCYHPSFDHPRCSPQFGCPGGMRCNTSSLVCEDEDLPCVSFSSQFDTCTLPLTGDLVIDGGASFDTSSLRLEVAGSQPVERMKLATHTDDVGAILAHDVRIAAGATLVGNGSAPMAIVASGRIMIERGALIDVSPPPIAAIGRAGTRRLCEVRAGDGGGGYAGVGGGGGGGYNGRGGAGGKGDGGAAHGGNGAPSVDAPGPRGGCGGGYGGGYGSGDGGGGRPGLGGGAIYLVAALQIDIGADARLMAAGTGGLACDGGLCGGGGGGSGGMIMLEAPRIVAPQAGLSANGGGGGGGSGPQPGLHGSNGTDSTERAGRGAAGGADATPGGFGGSRLVPMGDDVSTPAAGAGGGGGGGAGYIIIVSPDSQLSDRVSPEPIVRASAPVR